jgi:hypothetical protein
VYKKNGGASASFAVPGNFLVFRRFCPFAEVYLTRKAEQNDFVALPCALQDEGTLIGGEQASVEAFQNTYEALLVPSVGGSIGDE